MANETINLICYDCDPNGVEQVFELLDATPISSHKGNGVVNVYKYKCSVCNTECLHE